MLICPNCRLPALVFGNHNCGRLSILKDSRRNCSETDSRIFEFFTSDTSEFFSDGPRTSGNVRPAWQTFVRFLDGLSTAVPNGATIFVLAAVSGG